MFKLSHSRALHRHQPGCPHRQVSAGSLAQIRTQDCRLSPDTSLRCGSRTSTGQPATGSADPVTQLKGWRFGSRHKDSARLPWGQKISPKSPVYQHRCNLSVLVFSRTGVSSLFFRHTVPLGCLSSLVAPPQDCI